MIEKFFFANFYQFSIECSIKPKQNRSKLYTAYIKYSKIIKLYNICSLYTIFN